MKQFLLFMVMGGSAFAAEQIPLSSLEQYGIAGIIIAVMLYRDYKREQYMYKRDVELQSWVQMTLINVINENTKALRDLLSRPCLAEPEKHNGKY